MSRITILMHRSRAMGFGRRVRPLTRAATMIQRLPQIELEAASRSIMSHNRFQIAASTVLLYLSCGFMHEVHVADVAAICSYTLACKHTQ